MKQDFKKIVRNLPQLPGVYIYSDDRGEVIYVGKAKNLRSRVGSYFQTDLNRNSKTYSLVQKINDVRYIVVDNEFDALILEAELIKKYLPKYNIVLKDDKSFLYIVIKKGLYPTVSTSRKSNLMTKDLNFGPFTNSNVAKKVVRVLRRVFPFRDCSESKFNKYKKLKNPCLYGHIELCPAPCVNQDKMTAKNYRENILKIKRILSGGSSKLIQSLEKNMNSASKDKNYEKAVYYRDLMQEFNYVRSNYREAGDYIDNPYLMDDINKEALDQLKTAIPLIEGNLRRIECYDIANISGKDAVGSMVVATDGRIDKDEYKRFKIRFKDTPDDTDMLYDVLYRRFNNNWEHPDLVVVDGGKPQVSAAERALEDLNIKISVIGLAKKVETVVYREKGVFKEITLNGNNPGLLLLIRLRNEAHRFAQSYHHLLRLKSIGV